MVASVRRESIVPDLLGLSRVHMRGVTCLLGASPEQVAVALDPLPGGAPVVIGYRVDAVRSSVPALVDDVLGKLEAVACKLFPAWLPGAEHLDSRSAMDRRAARILARRLGASSDHFGPLVADLADAALLGRPMPVHYPREMRARELSRLLQMSYGRDGLVLAFSSEIELDHHRQRTLAAASEWLANHAPIGVWVLGGLLDAVDRFPRVPLYLPDYVEDLAAGAGSGRAAAVTFPPLSGKPHPGSSTEMALERALQLHDWAVGRSWNVVRQPDPLTPPIRIDLLWPDVRCVVELDGPDHRGALKYADDRRRDNALLLDGYSVLRFTNEQISEDLSRVLGDIERLLAVRRKEGIRE